MHLLTACILLWCTSLTYSQEPDLTDSPIETQWLFTLDGYNTTDLADILVDGNGNSYVAVNYSSTLSIPELNVQLPFGRHVARAIVKLDPEGRAQWALPFESGYDGRTEEMHFAENGDLLITGFCDDVSIYPSTDPGQAPLKLGDPKPKEQFHRNFYVFLARYTTEGERIWVKQWKSTWAQSGGIACKPNGDIYWSVHFQKELFADTGVEETGVNSSSLERLVTFILDKNGNVREKFPLTYIDKRIRSTHMISDRANNLIVYGLFEGRLDLTPKDSLVNDRLIDNQDAFIAKYDSTNELLWVRTLGGRNLQFIRDLQVDADGKLWLTGEYRMECVISSGVRMKQESGYEWKSGSSFVYASFFPNGDLDFVRYHNQKEYNQAVFGTSLVNVGNNRIFLAGSFSGSLNLDPTNDTRVIHDSVAGTFISVWEADSLHILQQDFRNKRSWAYISKVRNGGKNLIMAGNYYGAPEFRTPGGQTFKLSNRDYGRSTFICGATIQLPQIDTQASKPREIKNHLTEIEEILACLSPDTEPNEHTWFAIPSDQLHDTLPIPASEQSSPCQVHLNQASAILFPNPVKTSFTLSLSGFQGDLSVSIIAFNGELLLRHKTRMEEENLSLEFDVSHLATGTYYVNVVQKGYAKSFRLIKQ
ncbi:MAG: T9SS type A sorting domain-containing protein [Flavobacteriales bacterium]|nr:T9SS type A sorting domain-containing protein [Flavobacteriales bacterium]